MDRDGERGQKFLMDRSKKLPTWGKGVCVCVCQISGKNFKRLLWTVPSFNQKFEDFFFNFLAAIEFRDLKLFFVYHLIVDTYYTKTEVFSENCRITETWSIQIWNKTNTIIILEYVHTMFTKKQAQIVRDSLTLELHFTFTG